MTRRDIIAVILSLLGAFLWGVGVCVAQVPAKCDTFQPGAWVAADSLGAVYTDGPDSLITSQGTTLCIVAGAEWVRRTTVETTPAGAFVLLTPDMRAYMRVSLTPDYLWLDFVAPWYAALKPLRP